MEQSAIILVVDDERSLVDLVANFLAGEGYKVHRAYDGNLAIERRGLPLGFALLVDFWRGSRHSWSLLLLIEKNVTVRIVEIYGPHCFWRVGELGRRLMSGRPELIQIVWSVERVIGVGSQFAKRLGSTTIGVLSSLVSVIAVAVLVAPGDQERRREHHGVPV